jgi:hypothetical protein
MRGSQSITIRRRLRQVATGDLTIRAFTKWLASRMQSFERHQADRVFAHDVYLRLAEFSNGDWTEAELRSMLAVMVSTYSSGESDTQLKTGTSNVTAGGPVQTLAVVAPRLSVASL